MMRAYSLIPGYPPTVPCSDFSSLKLSPDMLNNLQQLGYHDMTPIQAQSLPYLLKNQDVIAKAKTGSGKTVAFGIGLLSKLKVREYAVQALVLCPTRELADQVTKELRKLARFTRNIKASTLCGGMPFGPQLSSLEHPPHIVVGTPGRIQEHLRKGSLNLNQVNTLVLDEADRMLDMGFQEAILQIIEHTPGPVREYAVQALVLCPTRELADQVTKELRKLARFTRNIKASTLCGGMPFGPQLSSLEHPPHIVVGTPGRIQEHLRKGSLNLNQVNTLVLDEADRMLDMGFQEAILQIIEHTPANRQTLLFSATYPSSIKQMSSAIQSKPVEVSVEAMHSETNIEQLFFEIQKHERENVLLNLLSHYQPESSLIFCNTKRQTQDVADLLSNHGHHALAIHGDLEQKDRDQVLVRFANNSCSILVATDVAARGLDIKNLQAVINFEISRDPEVYVHRIGRTGRAGNSGLALSLFSQDELYKLNAIEDYQQKSPICDVPASLYAANNDFTLQPPMVTLQIDGGRKDKVRPGDILGALTGEAGIESKHVGKIDIFERWAYVAIHRAVANRALKSLAAGKIKGRNFRVRKLL